MISWRQFTQRRRPAAYGHPPDESWQMSNALAPARAPVSSRPFRIRSSSFETATAAVRWKLDRASPLPPASEAASHPTHDAGWSASHLPSPSWWQFWRPRVVSPSPQVCRGSGVDDEDVSRPARKQPRRPQLTRRPGAHDRHAGTRHPRSPVLVEEDHLPATVAQALTQDVLFLPRPCVLVSRESATMDTEPRQADEVMGDLLHLFTPASGSVHAHRAVGADHRAMPHGDKCRGGDRVEMIHLATSTTMT